MANLYKWIKLNAVLKRLADDATIPWPPQESEGFRAKPEVDAGRIDPEDPPVPPTDFSDVDNQTKALKALALCIAQIGGLTVPQMKQLFKNKWDSLP